MSSEIHQSFFVVAGAVGIILGVILALVFRINFFVSPVWMAVVAVLFLAAYLKPKLAFMVVALVAGMIIAFFRAGNELVGEDYIRQFHGQTIMMSGVIDGDPETDENKTSFKLKDLAFGEEETKKPGNVYVTADKNEELARDDRVMVTGVLNEGFGIYAGYMYRPRIVAWERPEPGNLVLRVRNWFAGRISQLIPEPEVNLGLAYLLGMKTRLPDELSEKLRTVGLVHIVVASGAHLSILVEIAKKLFGKISRFTGFLFSALFVLAFMILVGWTPSILRAGVMSILAMIAGYVGRKIEPWRVILLVAGFTLIINPMFIINLGWLLSFASFSGIMILGPMLTRFFYGARKPGFIAETVITTISATLMTLPVILYYYGQISLISVVANLLILPTLAYVMGLVFLSGLVLGMPFIDTTVGFLATKLLDFHIMVVDFFSKMEQFIVKIDNYRAEVFFLYLPIVVGVVFGVIWRKKGRGRRFYDIMEETS